MNNDLEQFSEERLEKISSSAFYYAGCEINEIQALARIALSVKKSKPIGEIRLSEYRSDGTREASVVCLHDQADWDNFTNGTLLYLNPQQAHTEQVIPDGWKINQPMLDAAVADYCTTGKYTVENIPYELRRQVELEAESTFKAMLAAAPKPESE